MFPTNAQPHGEPEPSASPDDAGIDPVPAPGLPGWASRFQELEVDLGADVVDVRRVRENSPAQHVALFGSALLFAGFVAVVMPWMKLSTLGNVLWITGGIVVIALVGMFMHAKVETTRLRLDRQGISVEQGTELDHESIVMLWDQLAGADLEPVSETDGRKGMQLRLRPTEGEPVDVLPGVNVGELSNLRQVINEALARHRNTQRS